MTLGNDRFYLHILRVTFYIRLSYIKQPSDVSTVDLFVWSVLIWRSDDA